MNDLWKTLTFDQQNIQYNAHISKKKPLNILVIGLEEKLKNHLALQGSFLIFLHQVFIVEFKMNLIAWLGLN